MRLDPRTCASSNDILHPLAKAAQSDRTNAAGLFAAATAAVWGSRVRRLRRPSTLPTRSGKASRSSTRSPRKSWGPDRLKPVATLDWSAVRADDASSSCTHRCPSTPGSERVHEARRPRGGDRRLGRGDDLLKRFKIRRVRMPAGLSRPCARTPSSPSRALAQISRGQIGSPPPRCREREAHGAEPPDGARAPGPVTV